MMNLAHLDLLSVGIASAATGILGFIVFLNNRQSSTNRVFLFQSLVTIIWGLLNYALYNVTSDFAALWFTRLVMFSAVWQAFSIFLLFLIFPEIDKKVSKKLKYFLVPIVSGTSLLTLTPLVFEKVISFSTGAAPILSKGPGIFAFALVSVSLVFSGLVCLMKRTISAPRESRAPFRLILIGTFVTFALIVIFNFVLPTFYNDVSFIPFGAIFTFPFILCTSYAIIRHKIIDVKVVSTGVLTFLVVTLTFVEVVLSKTIVEIVLRSLVFIALFIFSILLIKSVLKEVRRREEIARLAESLRKANLRLKELDQQKTEFVSIASHQLRTPLSIVKGYLELLHDGAYGKPGAEMQKIFADMEKSNERLVKLVDEFLDITRIEQGRTKFVFADHDIAEMIEDVMKELTQKAKDRGVTLVWNRPKKELKPVRMDDDKIRHVIFNFVDNAIKYSPSGDISVFVEQENDGTSVRVVDHGFGFDKVDEANFFQKFYRGHNVKDSGIEGTGLGLYICHQFVEKHGGRIWAKSPGPGKGGEFGFWLPKIVKEVVMSKE